MKTPQIGQSDLVDVALQFKAFPQLGDLRALFLETIDPPSLEAIENAIAQLQSLGALTESEDITSLGRLLWQLGVHPALGKAVLLGSLFGCLEPLLIVACHDAESPLMSNLEHSVTRRRELRAQYLPEYETDFAWIIEAFREYHAANVAHDKSLMHELRETKLIRHRAYLDMMNSCQGIHDTLAQIGFVPAAQAGKSLFELLPAFLNANRKNMNLVKALLVNTVSAEMAAWRGADGYAERKEFWSIDSAGLLGMTSKHGVNEARGRSPQLLKRRYRTKGRLMAYTWKRQAPDGPNNMVFLEQASMVTPLTAILFCRTLVPQRSPQVLKLNNWLRLRLSLPEDVPSAVADQAATIMMELRKTIDRFVSLAWVELEKLYIPKGREPVQPPGQGPSKSMLGPDLRKVMVEAVVKMLDADEAYWNDFRSKRRKEIDLEIENIRKEKEEAAAVLKRDPPNFDDDEDDDEGEEEVAEDDLEQDPTEKVWRILFTVPPVQRR